MPILICGCRGTSANDIQNVFSGVVIFTALHRSTMLKIVDECHRVRAQITKVNCFTPLLQQKQSVKLIEQLSTRLVDRTQNRLTLRRKLLQETHNRPRRLCVQTRRRLVQEKQKTRLRRQLDADRETLPLLNIQTFAVIANNGFRKTLHLQ